ncbi:MAG: glycoside hydrolase family 3 C-terminal domain-containing protein [Oscillospiraceae bacterium]|nr:glycoside hydrolase family 3 C-terminal domain-containing protein [Oscillospiraceae bacterium]
MKIIYQQNPNGPVIGSVSAPILEIDGLYFKDLEGTGTLLPYEDWRLTPQKRAEDLASRLSVEEIAGLMMYSSHQMVPAMSFGPFVGTYQGKSLEESGAKPTDLTDQQKKFLETDHVRHVLAAGLQNAEIAAGWNNEMQAFVEKLPHGIPVNISSDPRNGAANAGAEYKSGGGQTSKWPEGLGIAATFDPELCRNYASILRKEYRALGIATALSPQVDIGTEPRWMRIEDTFGAHPELVADMGRAYCDGMQSDPEQGGDWGSGSVAAMAKHWPGGGPCEAGRDAHYAFGKFAVHPGGCENVHLQPFLKGVFRLDGKTGQTASIMPYYTVNWNMDPGGDNVGNSYSRFIIQDMLREQAGFEGVVCTDWGITGDPDPAVDSFGSRCYGVEHLTEAERHLRILENGVDQFGGNNDIAPILEAYRIGCRRHGEAAMRARFERSAARLLTNSFRCGLFENPYLDAGQSQKIVGCAEHCEAGFAAQVKSLVMLKNDGVLPIRERRKVYIPGRHVDARKSFFRTMLPAQELPGADRNAVEKYYDWADTAEEADFAVVFIESPLSDGYTEETGYRPVTLQYRPYTAANAREHSIGQGDFREADHPDRSYRGKTNTAANETDLELVWKTREAMGDKPVVVVVRMHNPCVLGELEAAADAIVVDFGVQQEAVMTILCGKAEPSGLLPVQLPADMDTVEAHCEDKPLDLLPYVDSSGNAYDFGFGLNWQGVIQDERTCRYTKI